MRLFHTWFHLHGSTQSFSHLLLHQRTHIIQFPSSYRCPWLIIELNHGGQSPDTFKGGWGNVCYVMALRLPTVNELTKTRTSIRCQPNEIAPVYRFVLALSEKTPLRLLTSAWDNIINSIVFYCYRKKNPFLAHCFFYEWIRGEFYFLLHITRK